MRIAFMGTPDFSVTALNKLLESGHEIVAVYTQPPRPANRGKVTPSPVQIRAEALDLPVYTPTSLKSGEEHAAFRALNLDVAVVAAYGLLLPQAILDAPRLGCLNIHASLLPRWRGAAPVQRAILAGDSETGVTIMQMEKGLDTGPMLAKIVVPIGEETTGELTTILADAGAELMQQILRQLPTLSPEIQPEDGVTYAKKIEKAEGRIDWTLPAEQLRRLVRAMQPSPGAWFEHDGQRVKLIAAMAGEGGGPAGTLLPTGAIAASEGAILPLSVQPEGKPRMLYADWLRGRRLEAGNSL